MHYLQSEIEYMEIELRNRRSELEAVQFTYDEIAAVAVDKVGRK